jgi:hypothetical protein
MRQVRHDLVDRPVNRLQSRHEPIPPRLRQALRSAGRQSGMPANDGQMRVDDMLRGRR